MQSIPTLFMRGGKEDGYRVKPILNPECEWVLHRPKLGNVILTIKVDGLNCKVERGQLFKRIRSKNTAETSYVPADTQDSNDKLLYEAAANVTNARWNSMPDGVYEVFGPGIQGNPQHAEGLWMVRIMPIDGPLMVDSRVQLPVAPSTAQDLYDMLKQELEESDVEGFVFHYEHPTMVPVKFAKIKRRDFGFKWPLEKAELVPELVGA